MPSAADSTSIRPSKREVIVLDDEDSRNEQPVEKSARRDAQYPVTSREVADLQLKNRNLEDSFEYACRTAADAETRAEFLENYIDSKLELKDDEAKRVIELEKKLAEISSQLEEARKEAENDSILKTELAREIESLKNGMDQMRKEHNDKMANLINRASDIQAKDRAIIADLTEKLAQFEDETQALLQQLEEGELEEEPEQQQRAAPAAAHASPPKKVAQLPKMAHPTNIFQLCSPDSADAISYEKARVGILATINESQGQTIDMKLNYCYTKLPELFDMVLVCEECEKTLPNLMAIQHFISKAHEKKVLARSAAVSDAAVKFWMDKLKPEKLQQPTEAARLAARPMHRGSPVPMQQPSAASAAGPKASGGAKRT